ncbi:MAG: RsmB/NOP family class I SAM-dependent RNA methyltransferase [Patescibacteria group bacterium]
MRDPLPNALRDRLTKQWGTGTYSAMLRAFSVAQKPTLRVNTLKSSDEAVMAVFRDEQIMFERIKAVPHAFLIKNRTDDELLGHPLAKDGKIYLQGISSMIPPVILEPRAGERILDLCAAPGSKTTEIAMMTNNAAEIIATEDNEVRFQKLENTIRVQSAKVNARHTDGTLLHKEFPEYFDKILVDAPCSAEGRININEKRTFGFWSEKNIVEHAKLQRRLLRAAVGCLKPGGTLVYSTCTLAPEENEQMVEWLITEFPQMKPVEISLPLQNAKKTAHKTITMLPDERMEGFFVAKLTKLA